MQDYEIQSTTMFTAEFCLAHLLMQRHPTMFFQHFVECVFHFNCYDGHNVYNKFPQTEKEKKVHSLKGRNNVEYVSFYGFTFYYNFVFVDSKKFPSMCVKCRFIYTYFSGPGLSSQLYFDILQEANAHLSVYVGTHDRRPEIQLDCKTYKWSRAISTSVHVLKNRYATIYKSFYNA